MKNSIVVAIGIAQQLHKAYSSLGETVQGDSFNFIPSAAGMIERIYKIIDLEKIQKSDSIIDLGCGVSPLLISLFLENYTSLTGVDTEQRYLNVLNSIGGNYLGVKAFTTIRAELDKVPLTIKKAKLIYLYQPIQNREVYIKAVKRVWRQMNKGSIILDLCGPISQCIPEKFKNHNLGYYKKS